MKIFPFQHFKYILPFPSGLLKDQQLSIWGFPCMLLVPSPWLLLIFFVCVSSLLVWLVCVLVCFSLGLSLDLTISFSMLGKFSTIVASKIFSYPVFFSSSFGTPNVGAFDIVPEVSVTILSSFHSFYFILLFRSYFHHFIFQLTDSFFCFRYSAIDSF